MKDSVVYLIFILILISNFCLEAKTNVLNKSAAQNSSTHLSTNIQFNGQLVDGKNKLPFESLAVVENEKNIDELIGVRKDFSDRIQKAKGLR